MKARHLLFILPLILAAAPSQPAEPVAIELVLALDSSASIDGHEFALQLDGLEAAFRDPDVLAAVEGLKPRGAAIVVMQWGGPGESKTVIPWTHLASARDAKALAHIIGLIQRWQRASSTSIATALDDGRRLIETNVFDGERKVIDVSGDGVDNGGIDLAAARSRTLSAGIVINGLAIEIEDKKLGHYYRDNVIGGTDAFVEKALDFEDFARAIREKLLQELRPLQS